MSDRIMPLSQAIEGYDLFDKMEVQKGMGVQDFCVLWKAAGC